MVRTAQLNKAVVCPWCGSGEVWYERKAKTVISLRCSTCRHFFRVDLETHQTERASACKRQGRNKKSY